MTNIWLTMALALMILGAAACGEKDERENRSAGGAIPEQQNEEVQKQPAEENQPQKIASLTQLLSSCAGIAEGEIADLSGTSRKQVTHLCRDLGATKFKQGISNTLEPATIN